MRSFFLALLGAAALSQAVRADEQPAPVPMQVAPGTTWHLQLQGALRRTTAQVVDADLLDLPARDIRRLHAQGSKVVCYFSAGTHEDWRADADQFPAEALGKPLGDWPGEHYLDVRNAKVKKIMKARLDHAKERGCDGVDPDNLDGYSNDSGFPITKEDSAAYARFLAREAHARGLGIGLKNLPELAPSLASKFDWALVESCYDYDECDAFAGFIRKGKAVFIAQYGDVDTDLCTQARTKGFDLSFFERDLSGHSTPCPAER
jgi:hypothetical protein